MERGRTSLLAAPFHWRERARPGPLTRSCAAVPTFPSPWEPRSRECRRPCRSGGLMSVLTCQISAQRTAVTHRLGRAP
eukprot:3936611-Rhodomonas_salina.2